MRRDGYLVPIHLSLRVPARGTRPCGAASPWSDGALSAAASVVSAATPWCKGGIIPCPHLLFGNGNTMTADPPLPPVLRPRETVNSVNLAAWLRLVSIFFFFRSF